MIRLCHYFNVSLFLVAPICFGQTFTITTVAGDGVQGVAGDGGKAVNAEIFTSAQIAVDSASNIYIADTGNCRIRKVTASTGSITTVAGSSLCGYAGDNGRATSASLNLPRGVAVDAFGNIFIGDSANSVVRKVDTSGFITTFAGTGTSGFSGDGGLAVNAQLGLVSGLAIDAMGALYLADVSNHRVRKVALDGTITTVAGNGTAGFSGNGGLATAAELYAPNAVAFDLAGNLYIAEPPNHAVRMVSPGGMISVVVGRGSGSLGFSGDNGLAINALVKDPQSVTVDRHGNIFISDGGNQRIRMVSASGIITTICGAGTRKFSGDGGPSTSAEIGLPGGIAAGPTGQVYFLDSANNRVRVLTPAGTTQAITFPALRNGPFGSAPIALVASATSGLAVSFLSNTPSVCTVSGATATFVGLGTCSLTARQPGNGTYAEATPVTERLTVFEAIGPVTLNTPYNGAQNVSLTPTLSWTAATGATSYDVYFGTSATPSFVTNTTSTSYGPSTLLSSTTYYWQIVGKNADGSSSSAVWSFTTIGSLGGRTVATAVLRDTSGSIRLSTFASSILSNSGGVFASDPTEAQDFRGTAFVTARDGSNAVWANVYDPGGQTWNGWQSGGGTIQGVPSIAMTASGTAWIASRDTFNSYWLVSYTAGAGFGTWTNLAGVFATDPAMTSCGDGSLYLVGKDNSNALWSGHYIPGTGFQGFVPGGGVVQGNPSVSCGSDSAAYISARDNDNSTWVARVSGNTWTGWFNGGAVANIDPRIAALGGSLAIVILDSTGAVYRTTFTEGTGNGWQAWTSVGGVLADIAPAGVGGSLFFAGRTPGGDLYWWQQAGNQWTWIGNNGVAAGALSAAPR